MTGKTIRFMEISKGFSIVTVHAKTFSGKPDVSSAIFKETPHFIAANNFVSGKIGKRLPIVAAYTTVMCSEP